MLQEWLKWLLHQFNINNYLLQFKTFHRIEDQPNQECKREIATSKLQSSLWKKFNNSKATKAMEVEMENILLSQDLEQLLQNLLKLDKKEINY